MSLTDEAVARGFERGMWQHREEILPFAEWLASVAPRIIIEIGTFQGGTAALFCHLASSRMISVDLPEGPFGGLNWTRSADRNRSLLAVYPHFVGILGDSTSPDVVAEVRRVLGPDRADLLFIDGDHSYDGAKGDYLRYRQFVRPGGAIALHDINDTPFHRQVGCRVDQLWRELPGAKREFNLHRAWGGIGVAAVASEGHPVFTSIEIGDCMR